MENYENRLDLAFAALADPTRRAIVARLCSGDATVGELAEPFEIGLPTLLKHIRVLERGGLVSSEKSGRVRTCSLTPGRTSGHRRLAAHAYRGVGKPARSVGGSLSS